MGKTYHADVIGSLLRPTYLKEAQKALAAGKMPIVEFKRIEDRAVDAAIAMQEASGVDVVTDGEMRRGHFISPLLDAIEGAERRYELKMPWKRTVDGQEKEYEVSLVHYRIPGKIRRARSLAAEEFAYARARARKPLKVTLPSPLLIASSWSPDLKEYPNPSNLLIDAGDLIREEARELAAMGCEYIQIDAPELTAGMSEARRQIFASQGATPEKFLTEGMEIINSIAGVPGVTFGLHVCRGNNQGRWYGSGGYEQISQQVFKHASKFDIFLLEYDDYRSGSFEPLKDLPSDKRVVLGLVSTKYEQLESADALSKRIAEAARYFPREQIAISTQCGFASTWEGNPLSEEAQSAKLRLVAEVAHQERQ